MYSGGGCLRDPGLEMQVPNNVVFGFGRGVWAARDSAAVAQKRDMHNQYIVAKVFWVGKHRKPSLRGCVARY